MRFIATCLLFLLIPGSGLGQTEPERHWATDQRAACSSDGILATVNGEAILLSEVDELAQEQLASLLQQIFAIRREALERLIGNRLVEAEAAEKGTSVEELLETLIGHLAVERDEALAFDQLAPAGLLPLDRLEGRARYASQILLNKKARAVWEHVQALKLVAEVRVYFSPPEVSAPVIPIDGDPVRGDLQAPITIIEFADFDCRHCQAAQVVLREVLEVYGDRVRLIFKMFPSPSEHSILLARSALCAREQGRFWEIHDALFANPFKGGADQMVELGQSIGLEREAFGQCVASNRYSLEVEQDRQEGIRAGVQGTPSFFIEGTRLVGLQELSAFREVIDRIIQE